MAIEAEARVEGGILAGGAGTLPPTRRFVRRAPAPGRTGGLAGRLRAGVGKAAGRVARDLSTEAARGTGLVAFSALFGAGAAVYFALPAEPPPVLLAACAMLALVAVAALPGRGKPVSAALLALALGMAAGALETARAATAMTGAGITTRVTALVAAVEEREGGRVRLTLDVLRTERPVLRYAPERIRATARAVPETLLPGETVTGVVRLLPATGPVRPDGYDFSFRSYFSGIGASGYFLVGPEAVDAVAEPGLRERAWLAVERFRERLADHIRMRIEGPEGEIAAALVAGVRGGITEADNEALRRTGLAHFISISGLHMALVAAIVLVSVRGSLALFPRFASRYPVKKLAAAAALAAVCGYIVISGQEVAAVRSFIMAAVMLVAVLFDRAALTMRNLAVSALIILAVAPHEVLGPSFQMSFGATAALIAAYAWHSQRRARRPAAAGRQGAVATRLLRPVAYFFGALAATSVIAGLATGIFGVWHFQRVSPLGLAANLAAMPIVSIVVMPAAVAASLAIPLGLDAPFFALMGWGLRMVMAVVHRLSVHSPVDAVGAIPAFALVTLSLALAIATIATTTTLRALALPLAAAGLISALARDLPDVLVSEDGRLVAMLTQDNLLAVNRARPPSFTMTNWLHATAASGVERPGKAPRAGKKRAGRAADEGSEPAAPSHAAAMLPGPFGTEGSASQTFICADDLCVARHAGGSLVAHAKTAAAAADACGKAALIVIEDPTGENPCPAKDTSSVVITRRELALRGSAAVHLAPSGVARVDFAIGPNPRIWHQQRRYSREARGLGPYRRPEPAAVATVETAQ